MDYYIHVPSGFFVCLFVFSTTAYKFELLLGVFFLAEDIGSQCVGCFKRRQLLGFMAVSFWQNNLDFLLSSLILPTNIFSFFM